MRRITLFLVALLTLISCKAQPECDPKANQAAVVEEGNMRFTVLTPELIRIQYSSAKQFEDRATFGIVNRNLPVPEFTTRTDDTYLYITTSALELRYRKGGILKPTSKSPSVLQITMKMGNRDVIWYPGKDDALNLKGTMRTLDNVGGETGRDRMENGIISRSGWSLIDESPATKRGDGSVSFPMEKNSEGFDWFAPHLDKDAIDWYFFGYGHNYKKAMGDFVKVAGRIPLPPKYMFGYWYSRYWAYSQQDFINLVKEIKDNDIPLDVMIMDMDWHNPGWTGWTWNKDLIPNPQYLLRYFHHNNLKVALNLHPADGVGAHEDHYAEMKSDLGLPASSTEAIPWKIEDYDFYKSMFSRIIREREKEGVDFWWLDWQQWLTSNYTEGLGETFWNNHVFWNDMVKNRTDRRPVIYHRWGGLGSHRYQIGFSGDTYADWATLKYQPTFTSTASNVGYGYWGHDLGGHQADRDNNPERYLRWMQFGVFTPIFRTHATNDPAIERRIWKYPNFEQLRQTVILRYALFPYIYTAARKSYDTGICINRPLYYDYPELANAYDFEDEYMFGPNILVAPMTAPSGSDGLAQRTTWLPEGKWWDEAKNRLVEGNAIFTDKYTLDQFPYFYKAGAVIVNYPKQNTVQETPETIILQCAPGATGEGSFYEDNGDNADYHDNYATTKYTYTADETSATLTIGGRDGSFDGMPQKRTYQVELLGAEGEPASVTVDGTALDASSYNFNAEKKVITVSIPMDNISSSKTLAVKAQFCKAETLEDNYSPAEAVVEQTPTLWITGSAVPGGTQPLEVCPENLVKFHGTLNQGELYIINTDGIREGTKFLSPRQVDANIVNDGIAYFMTTKQEGAAWAVDFNADNYRFTVNTSKANIRGELVTWLLELYLGGGCVAPNQTDDWYIEKFQPMVNSTTDRNIWTWVGELKNYPGNIESKRFKLLAQRSWTPKSLHPYTQDEALLTSSKINTNGGGDHKWAISKDGFYKITVDAFRETIKAEYLGTQLPSGIEKTETELKSKADIYNMAGQKVDDSYKGIVIQNGKKINKK